MAQIALARVRSNPVVAEPGSPVRSLRAPPRRGPDTTLSLTTEDELDH